MKKQICLMLMIFSAQAAFARTMDECSKVGEGKRLQWTTENGLPTYVPATTLPAGEYQDSSFYVTVSEKPRVRLSTEVEYFSDAKFENGLLSLKSTHLPRIEKNYVYAGENHWTRTEIDLEIGKEKFKLQFHAPDGYSDSTYVTHWVNGEIKAPFSVTADIELQTLEMKLRYGDAAWGWYPPYPKEYSCKEFDGFCKNKLNSFLKKLDSIKINETNAATLECTKTFIQNAFRGQY